MQEYYLGGYSSAKVVPGGNLTVLAAAAAQSGGRLQATFKLLLNGSAAQLTAQPLPVLSAASALTETGALVPHKGSQVRTLKPAQCTRLHQPCTRGVCAHCVLHVWSAKVICAGPRRMTGRWICATDWLRRGLRLGRRPPRLPPRPPARPQAPVRLVWALLPGGACSRFAGSLMS